MKMLNKQVLAGLTFMVLLLLLIFKLSYGDFIPSLEADKKSEPPMPTELPSPTTETIMKWQAFAAPNYNFRIEVPQQPRSTDTPLQNTVGGVSHSFVVTGQKTTLQIDTYTASPGFVVQLEDAANSLVDFYNGKIIDQSYTPFQGYSTKEVLMEKPVGVFMKFRVIVIKNSAYILSETMTTKDTQDYVRFVNSFQYTG